MSAGENIGSKELAAYIQRHIATSPLQMISFQRYMELCLYHPEYGYYSNERTKIGREGDFYTSSSIGTIMGEMIAHYFVQYIEKQRIDSAEIHIVEWGGGTGRLANQVLTELHEEFPEIYKRLIYTSVEESPYHRLLQSELLIQHKNHVQWLSAEEWFRTECYPHTIIFSNELLDAFPVHRIQCENNENCEIFVDWDPIANRFIERLIPIAKGPLQQYMDDHHIVLIEGQKAEINLAAKDWYERITKWLDTGMLVTIDYGDESHKIYSAERMNGTLMCYHKHRAYDNPYIYLGEQDITAHVNFTSCIKWGEMLGFDNWNLYNQKDFLILAGIMNKLQNHQQHDPFHPIAKKNRSIRQILLSDQMSELFKVLVQVKL